MNQPVSIERQTIALPPLSYGCGLDEQFVTVALHLDSPWRCRVSPIDHLMLDAKQAILDEQHRRFQVLHDEGRWQEAMQQFQVTMNCASDLLNESLKVLEGVLDTHRQNGSDVPATDMPPPGAH